MVYLSKQISMKVFLRKVGAFIIPPLVYGCMRILWWTYKKNFHNVEAIGERQYVCVTWHGELFITPQAYRHIHKKHPASAIISSHFDGSLIAKTLSFLHIKPLRGSSKKGAKQVLLQAFKSIKSGEEVLITPDGPRGPRHSMSDGAIGIALKSKLPIFVMNYKANGYWQLHSWDRFVIPKPFTTIDFYMQNILLEHMELEEAKIYLRKKMLENTIL